MTDTLVVEISGRRPGTSKMRCTELFQTKRDHLIISNDSEGYDTTWEIVSVPDDYRKWYEEHFRTARGASWLAPMNRSYAIKYARDHGYKYVVQLDDNIKWLSIEYAIEEENGLVKRKRYKGQDVLDKIIDGFEIVLEHTNAPMVGCGLGTFSGPEKLSFVERYCYSIFGLNLATCPSEFQGDFEDDIEYRLKCAQMGMPVIQVCFFKYAKMGQHATGDMTGCRADYVKAGVLRGEHMSKLYGDLYSCGMTNKTSSSRSKTYTENVFFKHKIKPIKVGCIVRKYGEMCSKMTAMLKGLDTSEKEVFRVKVIKDEEDESERVDSKNQAVV